MPKEGKLFLGRVEVLQIKYDFYDKDLDRRLFVRADFPNGLKLYDPYSIALALIDLPKEFFTNRNVALLQKKVVQYFRKKIPYSDIVYMLLGGDRVWQDERLQMPWDEKKAMEFWKGEIDEILMDAFTIEQVLVAFCWLRSEIMMNRLHEFRDYLNK